MVLVDTSVWIDHFQKNEPQLRQLLFDEEVLTHPFIIGELACGSIKNRSEILTLLHALPSANVAENKEVHGFIEHHKLYGLGLGLIDVHLITSSLLSNSFLWTRDKTLIKITTRFKINIYC